MMNYAFISWGTDIFLYLNNLVCSLLCACLSSFIYFDDLDKIDPHTPEHVMKEHVYHEQYQYLFK